MGEPKNFQALARQMFKFDQQRFPPHLRAKWDNQTLAEKLRYQAAAKRELGM
jgi:hypothetical protein